MLSLQVFYEGNVQGVARRFHGDGGGILNGKSVDAATDGRERNGFDFVFHRQLQGAAITAGQDLTFAAFSAGPNRTDRVNDKTRGQVVAGRDFRFARPA